MSRAVAHTATRPSVTAAETIDAFKGLAERGCDINALVAELDAQVDRVRVGKMGRCEALLVAQAHTLDAIFNNLARRALKTEYLQQMDAFLRLALKAQSQCRATTETLAEIKNPRAVAFVTQANIAHGPQQVNNVVPAKGVEPSGSSPDQRARKLEGEQNELLGVQHGARMDRRTSGTGSTADPELATVGEIDGTTNVGRENTRKPQCLPGRHQTGASWFAAGTSLTKKDACILVARLRSRARAGARSTRFECCIAAEWQ